MGLGYCYSGNPKSKSYQIIDNNQESESKTSLYPPCAHCGANNSIKHSSLRFMCNSCGRTFTGKYKGKPKLDTSDRPPCPDCKSKHIIISSGSAYQCKDCGRNFRKIYRKKKKVL